MAGAVGRHRRLPWGPSGRRQRTSGWRTRIWHTVESSSSSGDARVSPWRRHFRLVSGDNPWLANPATSRISRNTAPIRGGTSFAMSALMNTQIALVLLGLALTTGCAATPDDPSPTPVVAPIAKEVKPNEFFYAAQYATSLAWYSGDATYCSRYGNFDCNASCGSGTSIFASGSACSCACLAALQMSE